ncbi:MAG: VacJ family lipoprotein [Rhodospirillum sp.]|nr:VacJ family lipoprotein [Rhodospirillum sp.]MCF8489960.1 VacJ family lipoprotein [Rhodospirillum sp.]
MTNPITDITRRLGGRLGGLSRSGITAIALMSLTACANVDTEGTSGQLAAAEPANDMAAEDEVLVSDPLEPWNRYVFSVNDVVYSFARPWIAPYMVLPDEGKDTVDNFLHNLTSPVILLNDLLQGEMGRAWTTVKRFGINTTSGVLGLVDVADEYGMPKHEEDFGQTLGTWGMGDGPYLVLPLLGPSNPRDGIGRGVDTVTDPLFWLTGGAAQAFSGARTYGTFSNEYGRRSGDMDALRESSLDYYATIRSLYTQMRRSKIQNIEGAKVQDAEVDYFSQTR